MKLDQDKVRMIKEYLNYNCKCGACLEVDITDTPVMDREVISFRCPKCDKNISIYGNEFYLYNRTYRRFD